MSEKDIVERLREAILLEGGFNAEIDEHGEPRGYEIHETEIGKEAADEIERLRALVNETTTTCPACKAEFLPVFNVVKQSEDTHP